MLEAQVERVAAVAARAASDAGEARADLQLAFFLQGRSRASVLETITKYNDDKPGVQDGTKEKGAPLKCRIYEALGMTWPLSEDQPGREETLYGLCFDCQLHGRRKESAI